MGDGRETLPDFKALALWAHRKWASPATAEELEARGWQASLEHLRAEMEAAYTAKTARLGEEKMGSLERFLVLNSIDHKWKDHLYAMDGLRSGIGLRGYAQVDPKNEYKREGLLAFQDLLASVAEDVTNYVLRLELREEPTAPSASIWQGARAYHPDFRQQAAGQAAQLPGGAGPAAARPRPQMAVGYEGQNSVSLGPGQRSAVGSATSELEASSRPADPSGRPAAGAAAEPPGEKVPRNAPCPCGSGKKFKQCHGK